MNRRSEDPRDRLATVEARFAARLAAGLNECADAVPHDVGERLRAGRERVLALLPEAAPAIASPARAAAGLAVVGHGQRSAPGGGPRHVWLRLAAWAPLVALLAGLMLIHEHTVSERVRAAAEIDALLLADDLPPQAWADPGFHEYLKALLP